jgi:DNA replication protein DnaC
VENFLAEEDGLRFRDTGLLFTGPPGAGKTHLAVGVLQALIDAYRVEGRFVDFTDLTLRLQATFARDSPISTSAILQPLERCELLVLDELGSQKLSAWTRDVLYHLINGRYQRRLPTLFTTNYRLPKPGSKPESLDRGPDPETAAPLSQRIPPMLFSRLHEMARPVVLDAVSDYRENRRHSV